MHCIGWCPAISGYYNGGSVQRRERVPTMIRERQQRHEQSILFRSVGDARVRRQILRWLIQDHSTRETQAYPEHSGQWVSPESTIPSVNPSTIETLRTALQDDDWEVQMTAMLAIGRLGIGQLRSDLDKLRLPSAGATGLTSADCHMLAAARAVVIAALNVSFDEERLAETLTRMPGVSVNFAHCVLGLPFDAMDAATLFVTSLTTPVPTVPDVPEVLPAGIVRDATTLRLGTTDIEMIWIPPIPHWLGDGLGDGDGTAGMLATPIRCHTPTPDDEGYFIAKRPLSASQLNALMDTPVNATPFGVALGSYENAVRWCELLTYRSGATVLLPTADMWEMAARGPDGRRYPWGNNIERAAFMRDTARIRTVLSPWGVQETVGVVPQWVTQQETATPLLCGIAGTLRVTGRAAGAQDGTYAVRPVVISHTK